MTCIGTQLNTRRAWVKVDTAVIAANTHRMCALVGANCQVLGVVKANAYGHGAARAAQAMLRGGAHGVVVATVGEAAQVRDVGIAAPVLVLGPPDEHEIASAVALDVTLAISDIACLHWVMAVARARLQPIRAHLAIDTGMQRLGFSPAAAGLALAAVRGSAEIEWTGIFTHFACADQPWRAETPSQMQQFEQTVAALANAGYHFPLVHAANSAATLAFPQARYNAVRPGIALYGIAPSEEIALPHGFAPALSFHTTVVQITDVPANSPVSYGGSYRTTGPRRIATIAAGYADGLRRSPAWREVLISGRRAPIVGRICMDYAMVDITGIAAAVGDEVVLLGTQGVETIAAEEVAAWLGTSAYEVMTGLRGERTKT